MEIVNMSKKSCLFLYCIVSSINIGPIFSLLIKLRFRIWVNESKFKDVGIHKQCITACWEVGHKQVHVIHCRWGRDPGGRERQLKNAHGHVYTSMTEMILSIVTSVQWIQIQLEGLKFIMLKKFMNIHMIEYSWILFAQGV